MNEHTLPFADPMDDRLNEAISTFEDALDDGETPDPQAWLDRFPDAAEKLRKYFVNAQILRRLVITPEDELIAAGVFADYEILAKIGSGGMGDVYKARRKSTQQIVALKLIRPELLRGLTPEQHQKI